MTITNAEIVGRLKLLADEHLKADSGSTTTAVSSYISDGSNYSNYYICFISGDNANVDRVVTSYESSTGTFTFDALDNAVTNVDEFCLVLKSFQSDVTNAHAVVRNDLRNMGKDVDLFLNYATQLKECYIYKTIELVCAGLMNDAVDTDVYYSHMVTYNALYQRELDTLIADYDADESGDISTDEELVKSNYVVVER